MVSFFIDLGRDFLIIRSGLLFLFSSPLPPFTSNHREGPFPPSFAQSLTIS